MTQVNPLTLVIEGRTFVQDDPTFEQEMYILEQSKLTGLMDVGDLKAALQSGDPEANIEKLLPAIRDMLVRGYQSGRLFHLLASLMTEQGTEWTPEVADANAEFFKHVRDRKSKQQLQPALAAAVLAFFESAVSFDATSLISLDESDPSHGTIVPHGDTPVLTPEAAGAVFRSGTSKPRSGKSRSPTASTSASSSDGKSEKDSSPASPSDASEPSESTTMSA